MLPADLTKTLASRGRSADRGATELTEHGARAGYFPGFDMQAPDEDLLPELSQLRIDDETYQPLCRACDLRAVDDSAWWQTRVVDKSDLVSAMRAAECLLRIPAVRFVLIVISSWLTTLG